MTAPFSFYLLTCHRSHLCSNHSQSHSHCFQQKTKKNRISTMLHQLFFWGNICEVAEFSLIDLEGNQEFWIIYIQRSKTISQRTQIYCCVCFRMFGSICRKSCNKKQTTNGFSLWHRFLLMLQWYAESQLARLHLAHIQYKTYKLYKYIQSAHFSLCVIGEPSSQCLFTIHGFMCEPNYCLATKR